MPAHLARSRRVRLFLLLGPLLFLHLAGTVADWFSPFVLAHAPLVELFLNPRIRYLALVADRVSPAVASHV